MTTYKADDEGMKEYSALIAAMVQADIQRQHCIEAIARWEKAHAEEIPDTVPAGGTAEAAPAED